MSESHSSWRRFPSSHLADFTMASVSKIIDIVFPFLFLVLVMEIGHHNYFNHCSGRHAGYLDFNDLLRLVFRHDVIRYVDGAHGG